MEIKRKEEDWNEWYGLDEMVMLGSTCLRLTEKEKGEKQGLGGERSQDEKKKKEKKRKYYIKNRKSQILEHAIIFSKLLFKK